MKRSLFRLMLTLALVPLVSTFAYAQGGSSKSSLSGLVQDSGGGVIPGATVVVKNNDTGVTFNTISNSTGTFSVPALDIGTYTITVSLSGFKTAVIKDQRVVSANPASVKITLDIGSLSETVEVKGGTELVQTQSGTISSTLNTDTLKNIPLQTRNALYAVTLLPGVETTGGPRGSTISGLPQYTINIALDGVNVSNNMQRQTDGFYAMVRPQLDAIEEVTLTEATQGADSAGQGAVQIRFVTRSGTNAYKGTAYDYFRHPALNTNYWFNIKGGLDKNRVILHQAGASEGGPIRIPGLYDGHGKAFFFFNYEEFYQPTEVTRTATVFNPLTQSGTFQYNVTSGGVTTVRTVDLLSLAAANGQTAAVDPTIVSLLGEMRAAALKGGTPTQNTDPNTMNIIFKNPGKGTEHLPTTRVDFNLTTQHRLSGVYYWQAINRIPDILNGGDSALPGLPSFSNYLSHRTVGSATLRSTLSPGMVNELVGGWQWSPSHFNTNISTSQFVDQGGFNLNLPLVTSATIDTTYENRNTPNWNVDDTVNWLRGRHSLSFGGSFTQIRQIDENGSVVPSISFGVQTSLDPADAMFNTTNFTGAANSDLNSARSLYALLTGRITAVNGTARLDESSKYVYLGPTTDHLRFNEVGLFAQDSFRVTPTLTVNAGVRWEYQTPVVPLNGNYSTATLADICGVSGLGTGPGGRGCNLFKPGSLPAGTLAPQYTQYTPNSPGYSPDKNNFAPNISAAWRPNVQHGIGRAILGDPEQATIRGGYSVAYNRNGMDEFQTIFGTNPGRSTSGNRNNNLGNLVGPGETWPLLFSQKNRLGAAPTCTSTGQVGCIPTEPTYPLVATISNNMAIFDPNIQLSHATSMSLGLQRAVSKDMVVEVRYVGTRNNDQWTTETWNEQNMLENGFLNEFKLAQANLLANQAAGQGNTFRYTGVPGTSPLPIFLAHYTGVAGCGAADASCPGKTDPTKYTGTTWTNTTLLGFLSTYQPNPGGFASTNATNGLYGSATFRNNGLATGLPANFWLLNPNVAGASVRTSAAYTKYDSVQLDVRRRLSRGLIVNGNYTYAVQYGSTFDSLHFDRYLLKSTNVPHAFKFNGTYEIPVGRGKRFGTNMNAWLDGLAGGWSYSVAGRVQWRTLSTGSRLVGMTPADLQSVYYYRIDPVTRTVTMLPDDIILNTRRAFSTDATSTTGYGSLGVPTGRYFAPIGGPGCVAIQVGECGDPRRVFVRAPAFTRFDMTLRKKFPLGARRSFEVQIDALNVFNAIDFNPVFNPGSGATIFQVTSAYTDLSNSYDPGGRLGQLVFRINW